MTGWEYALADLEHATKRLTAAVEEDWSVAGRALEDRGAAIERIVTEDFLLVPAELRASVAARLEAAMASGGAALAALGAAVASEEAGRRRWEQVRKGFGGAEAARFEWSG
jgi:hypothetical protein